MTGAGETSPPVLSIIIANYNAREALAGCLASIDENPPHAPYEVFVVDDASSDGSADAGVPAKHRVPSLPARKGIKNAIKTKTRRATGILGNGVAPVMSGVWWKSERKASSSGAVEPQLRPLAAGAGG